MKILLRPSFDNITYGNAEEDCDKSLINRSVTATGQVTLPVLARTAVWPSRDTGRFCAEVHKQTSDNEAASSQITELSTSERKEKKIS